MLAEGFRCEHEDYAFLIPWDPYLDKITGPVVPKVGECDA
jgi:hypothetical protein